MVCDFVEKFFEGSIQEYISRDPMLALLYTIAVVYKMPLVMPMLADQFNEIIENGSEEVRFFAAFVIVDKLAYTMGPKPLLGLISKSREILKKVYEKCGHEDVAKLVAEANAHLILSGDIETLSETKKLFDEALGILERLKDDSPGYYRSLGILYMNRSRFLLRIGKFRESIKAAKKALSLFKAAEYNKFLGITYEVLTRGYYVSENEKNARKAAAKFVEVMKGANPYMAADRIAFLYIYTGFEFLYDNIISDLPIETPMVSLAKAYHMMYEDWDQGSKKLSGFMRIRDPVISTLAFIAAGRVDVDFERALKSFQKAVSMAISAKLLELARLAYIEAKKKGLPKKELEMMRNKIREAYRGSKERSA